MADKPSAGRKVRVTFLEPVRALAPTPEELATRVVSSAFKERVTFLEPVRALDPSPEELATRVAPLINVEPPAIPPAVSDIIAQAAAAVRALEPDARAAAVAEFKRLAG